MWPTMVALVNLEDLQRISKRYKKTAAGTLIKIDCEDEEDDETTHRRSLLAVAASPRQLGRQTGQN